MRQKKLIESLMTKKNLFTTMTGYCYPSGVTATAPPIQLIYNFFQKQKERKLTLVKQGLFFCIFRYTLLSFMFLLLNVKKKKEKIPWKTQFWAYFPPSLLLFRDSKDQRCCKWQKLDEEFRKRNKMIPKLR